MPFRSSFPPPPRRWFAPRRSRWLRWGLAAALLAAVTAPAPASEAPPAAFDLSPAPASRPRAARNPEAVAAIAPAYRFVVPGVFTVGIAPSVPPIATYATDARTVVGADADIAQAVADSLGLRLDLVPVAWADWPLGLASGKYDAVISNVGVTEQRKEKFDFSTYRQGLHGFFAPLTSQVTRIVEPADAAGLRIVVGAGTNQERILLEWSRRNVAAGLRPISLLYFDDQPTSLLALQAGRADVIVQPHSQLLFIAARDRNIRKVGVLSAGWPDRSDVAITTRKGAGLAGALTTAINGLIQSGRYGEILARWSLEDEALPRSETNPPGLPSH